MLFADVKCKVALNWKVIVSYIYSFVSLRLICIQNNFVCTDWFVGHL